MLTLLRAARDRKGVAALEFALILPLMIALTFGVYELSEPMIIYQQVYSAAHSIAASASSLAVQADGSTSLTYAQVQFEASTIFAEIPALRSGQQAQKNVDGVTISSIVFEPTSGCVPSTSTRCIYNANIVWSVAYTGGNSSLTTYEVERGQGAPCASPLDQENPWNGPVGSLPTKQVSNQPEAWPDPILVVDVFFQYKPLLLTYTNTPIEFSATGLWPVRSVKAASVDSSGNATALRPDQQYTTLQGIGSAPAGSYCVNPSYPESSS